MNATSVSEQAIARIERPPRAMVFTSFALRPIGRWPIGDLPKRFCLPCASPLASPLLG
jgi:hypothetical protein